MDAAQMTLFEWFDELERNTPDSGLSVYTEPYPSLCPHRFSVGKNGDGWTRQHDPDEPYFDMWVDSNPNCRRPGFIKEQP